MLTIEAAFRAACAAELDALKPGNVHIHADGHGMTVADFTHSIDAAAGPLCRNGAPLGVRILDAVRATSAAVGQNTNLGILLLCAPLAMAAERGGTLRTALSEVIARADIKDTDATFRAIALAAPGGLGTAPAHDVHAPASVSLVQAMDAASARDMIARQYATDYADVFDDALPAYQTARAACGDRHWAIVDLYLFWLSRHPDSHVVRKHGAARAAALQQAASATRAGMRAPTDWRNAAPRLLAWDAALKAEGVNPGTSADLTVATIFAASVRSSLRATGDDGSFRRALPHGGGMAKHTHETQSAGTRSRE